MSVRPDAFDLTLDGSPAHGRCARRSTTRQARSTIRVRADDAPVTQTAIARVLCDRRAITQPEFAMKVVYILLLCLWLYWSFTQFQSGNTTGALIYLGIGVALFAWRLKRLKA